LGKKVTYKKELLVNIPKGSAFITAAIYSQTRRASPLPFHPYHCPVSFCDSNKHLGISPPIRVMLKGKPTISAGKGRKGHFLQRIFPNTEKDANFRQADI
jgi:hypothetical protein